MSQLADSAASGPAAGIPQVHTVAGSGLRVALFGSLFDKQYPGTLRPVVGEGGLPIAGSKTAGGIRPSGFPHRQIYKGGVGRNQVQPRLAAHASGSRRLGAGYSFDIVDTGALRPAEDLNKSLSVCSGERKYFAGASGIKISDNIDPSP
jgi:hypothetical protein